MVLASPGRQIRLRKLYEMGGAYRATILLHNWYDLVNIVDTKTTHRKKNYVLKEKKTHEHIIRSLTELVCLGVSE